MRPVKKQVVAITFYDHAAWEDKSSSMKPLLCEAVGYLVYEDKLYYRLVSWITENNLEDENCEGFGILKSTVTKVRRFR